MLQRDIETGELKVVSQGLNWFYSGLESSFRVKRGILWLVSLYE